MKDDNWSIIFLHGSGHKAKDNPQFVEAVFWDLRTGNPWRDSPTDYGHWHRTYIRFARWREGGVWKRVADALCSEADLEY